MALGRYSSTSGALEGSLMLQGRQLLCGREHFSLERDWRKDPHLAPSLWGDYVVKGHAGLRRLAHPSDPAGPAGLASGGLIWHKRERAALYPQIINRNLAKRLPSAPRR